VKLQVSLKWWHSYVQLGYAKNLKSIQLSAILESLSAQQVLAEQPPNFNLESGSQ
jgi:hypothetical protein